MKRFVSLLFAGALLSPALLAQNDTPAAPGDSTPVEERFPDVQERNSYAIGVMIANNMLRDLGRGGYDVNPEVVARAFTEAFTSKSVKLTPAEAESIVRAYTTELRQKAEEKRRMEGEKNKTEGEEFLAENKNKEGVITLPSGLQYKVLTQGTGPRPGTNDTVVTQYRGTLLDGTEFDSSYAKGQPATFNLGRGLIKGWTEALQLMPTGSKWQLFIPSDLAYGPNGSQKIGPNAVLAFELELLDIKPPVAPATPTASAGAAASGTVTSDIIKVPSKAELDKGAQIEVIKKEDLERLQQEAAARRATNPPPPVPPSK